MKTIKKYIAGAMLVGLLAGMATPAKAQISLNTYFNADWQFNFPVSNSFSDVASGWGMNFEGGYYVTPNLAVGAFINYHTNNEYFSRRTLKLDYNSFLNTDQQHQMFQMPFGLLAHYRFVEANFQPYVGLKLGADYTQFTSDFYIFGNDENTWGFYVSPEVGFNYYPWPNGLGFHLALYYNFATNSCSLMSYDVSNLNNLGFRVGLAF